MDNYTPIYAAGKVVGKVRGDTFYKTVRGSIHFLRSPRAIAFDVSTLTQAEQAKATWVQVHDIETHIIYRAPLAHILKVGIKVNRGYGPQIALVMEAWITTRPGDPIAAQLSLFGNV